MKNWILITIIIAVIVIVIILITMNRKRKADEANEKAATTVTTTATQATIQPDLPGQALSPAAAAAIGLTSALQSGNLRCINKCRVLHPFNKDRRNACIAGC